MAKAVKAVKQAVVAPVVTAELAEPVKVATAVKVVLVVKVVKVALAAGGGAGGCGGQGGTGGTGTGGTAGYGQVRQVRRLQVRQVRQVRQVLAGGGGGAGTGGGGGTGGGAGTGGKGGGGGKGGEGAKVQVLPGNCGDICGDVYYNEMVFDHNILASKMYKDDPIIVPTFDSKTLRYTYAKPIKDKKVTISINTVKRGTAKTASYIETTQKQVATAFMKQEVAKITGPAVKNTKI